jgi:acyl dehydratase
MATNHPAAPDGLSYLEDLRIGDRYSSASYAMDVAQIKAFAAQFDPQPFHLDEAAARDTLFAGLAASGWHTAAVTMKLLVTGDAHFAGGVVGAGVELSWPTPTRPDDVLHVESEVVAIVPSQSRPDRGIVTLRSETLNQHGKVVQKMVAKLVVRRRSTEGSKLPHEQHRRRP